MKNFEQSPPIELYIAVTVVDRSEDGSLLFQGQTTYTYRTKPYPKLSAARARLTMEARHWGAYYRGGWIEEATSIRWVRLAPEEPGKRRRCPVCGAVNRSVYERTVDDNGRMERMCADCFDRVQEQSWEWA